MGGIDPTGFGLYPTKNPPRVKVQNYRWPRCSPFEIAVFICASHVWNALRKLNHKVQTFSAIKDTNVPQIKDTNVTKQRLS